MKNINICKNYYKYNIIILKYISKLKLLKNVMNSSWVYLNQIGMILKI